MRTLIALCLPVLMAGCNTYNLTVNKTVIAFPHASVEMNSITEASDNTSNPATTTTPTLDVSVPLVP